jgi:hypothetical protein
VRWDEKRLDAYAEYAHALKHVISIALRLTSDSHTSSGTQRVSPEDELAILDAAEEERTIRWEAVLLLGSNEVVIAGRRWHECVFRLERLAQGQPSDMSLSEAIDATGKARREFYEAAKKDIGIDVGASPEAYEWQLSKIAGASIDGSGDPTAAGSLAPLP